MRWSIWLAHHSPEDHARCTRLGPVVLCRRCTAAWPLAVAVIGAGLATGAPPAGPLALLGWWALPLAEYTAVHALGRPYSPRRTWVFGGLLGVALGRTLDRYLRDPTDLVAWAALALAAGIGGLSAAAYHLRVKNRESV